MAWGVVFLLHAGWKLYALLVVSGSKEEDNISTGD